MDVENDGEAVGNDAVTATAQQQEQEQTTVGEYTRRREGCCDEEWRGLADTVYP
jgi:hypothetical protein